VVQPVLTLLNSNLRRYNSLFKDNITKQIGDFNNGLKTQTQAWIQAQVAQYRPSGSKPTQQQVQHMRSRWRAKTGRNKAIVEG